MAASGAVARCSVQEREAGRRCHGLYPCVVSAGRDPFTSKVIDSLFVGETENIGNPTTPEEKDYGRSLPKAMIPDFPIRGYEYYDYRDEVVNVTFRNYRTTHSQDRSDFFPHVHECRFSTENSIEGAKFVHAKPVYFPPMEKKWAMTVWTVSPGRPRPSTTWTVRSPACPILDPSQQQRLQQPRDKYQGLSDQADVERRVCGAISGV